MGNLHLDRFLFETLLVLCCSSRFKAVTYRNSVKYSFVNKYETFIVFSQPDLSRIEKLSVLFFFSLSEYSYFHGDVFIYVSSIRIWPPYDRMQSETLVISQRL